jgi:FkbM family methyltransferase
MAVWSRFKRGGERAWYARSRLALLDFPVPWRLPYGAWFLCHPDAMGARVIGYQLAGHPYEESDWKFVKRNLEPGDVFIDVGANQGFFTLLASRSVGDAGRVYAFEPAQPERQKLRRNLSLNRCSNVTVEDSAVGAMSGSTEFHLYLDHAGPWSGLRPAAEDVQSRSVRVTVPITTLDAYVTARGLDRVDMIKIDVEGGELDVFRGASDVIEKQRPIILAEMQEQRTKAWGHQPADVRSYLEQKGYAWLGTGPDGEANLDAGAGDAQNLVAVPVEKLGTVSGHRVPVKGPGRS